MNFKNKFIAVLLLTALGASSCKKGWLDVTSASVIRADDQFKSEAGFKDALMGVYIGMTDASLYGSQLSWSVLDILAHQYDQFSFQNATYYQVQQHNYRGNKSTTQLDAIWNGGYNVIANINTALNYIETNKQVLHPISYSIIKGELLGLRAYIHFDLLRLYGYGNLAVRSNMSGKLAIPYVTKLGKDITPQLSYDETLKLLIADIEQAETFLKEDPIYNNPKKPESYYAAVNKDGFLNNRESRMNYYALLGVKARVYNWFGGATNMDKAAVAAKEVIDFSTTSLASTSVATDDPFFYQEHLFNLNVMGLEDKVDRFLNGNSDTNVDALLISTANAGVLYEITNSNIGLVDVRQNKLLVATPRGLFSNKLHQANRKTYRNTIPLMRLPEMYYILAEQKASTDMVAAVGYLNQVRSKRGILENISTSINPSTFMAELQKEYRKEFFGEGHAFYYYKRLGVSTITGYTGTINDNFFMLPYPDAEIEFGQRVQ